MLRPSIWKSLPVFRAARVLAALAILWSLAPNHSSYYTVLRHLVCPLAVFVSLQGGGYRSPVTWIFGAIALLFNPLVPFTFDRDVRIVVSVLSGLAFLGSEKLIAKWGIRRHENAENGISIENARLGASLIAFATFFACFELVYHLADWLGAETYVSRPPRTIHHPGGWEEEIEGYPTAVGAYALIASAMIAWRLWRAMSRIASYAELSWQHGVAWNCWFAGVTLYHIVEFVVEHHEWPGILKVAARLAGLIGIGGVMSWIYSRRVERRVRQNPEAGR